MNNNENREKSNKGLIAIILILVVIILGMGIYITFDKGIISINLSQKENKNKNDKKVNDKKYNEEKVEKQEEIKPLDLSKCLNNDNNTTYSNPSESLGDHGLAVEINKDKMTATLSIDWNKFGPLSTASSWSGSIENYAITGFTKKITSAFVGGYGQDSMGTTLFYLMEDQTVEYTPMFVLNRDSQGNSYYTSSKTGENYSTKGQILGVKDVVKLYIVNKSTSNGNGGVTTIAAIKDGSFYDLGNLIRNN